MSQLHGSVPHMAQLMLSFPLNPLKEEKHETKSYRHRQRHGRLQVL